MRGPSAGSMFRLVMSCSSMIVTSVLLISCANKETYKPEHITLYRNKDITVYLYGGMIVRFDAGKYVIREQLGTTVIKGSGTEIVSVLPYRIKPFEGEVGLA